MRQQFDRELDANVEVRKAVESDAAAFAEIERRCPIVTGGKSMYFDRGTDYFASNPVDEEATVGIAFVDGKPAAASCGALHKIRVGGAVRPLVTVTHLRVLPEHQRKGLWAAVNRIVDHYFDEVDGSRAYISVENAGMQHGFTNTPNKWSKPTYRMQLATANLAGPPAGRDATPGDAGAIVEIMNRCHEREEQYLPYTEASFAARVKRWPKDYSWSRVRMTDRAAVGVWARRRIAEGGAGVGRRSHRVSARDHG
jgi:GNAT superfamily N-acetyltransferase